MEASDVGIWTWIVLGILICVLGFSAGVFTLFRKDEGKFRFQPEFGQLIWAGLIIYAGLRILDHGINLSTH